MDTLEDKLTREDVRTGNVEGRAYEVHAARRMAHLLYRQLGIRVAKPVYRYQADEPDLLRQMNNAAPEARQLDEDELDELADADMVFTGQAGTMLDSNDVYVVVEASITGDVDDVTRADRRRDLMERMTGAPCLAAIVTETPAGTGGAGPQERPGRRGKAGAGHRRVRTVQRPGPRPHRPGRPRPLPENAPQHLTQIRQRAAPTNNVPGQLSAQGGPGSLRSQRLTGAAPMTAIPVCPRQGPKQRVSHFLPPAGPRPHPAVGRRLPDPGPSR